MVEPGRYDKIFSTADMEREIKSANSEGFVNALILVALLLGLFFLARYLFAHLQLGWTP